MLLYMYTQIYQQREPKFIISSSDAIAPLVVVADIIYFISIHT